jgi:hypothetical protein
MSTLGASYPTLLEVSKLFGVDGKPLAIADMLSQHNELLDDIPWFEANDRSGHRVGVETGLPEAVYRKLNGGILPSKGTSTDVIEAMASLTSLGKVDKLLADLSGNVDVFRLRKNLRHMEAMRQKFLATLFYGDSTINPEQFLGLAGRFYDIGAGAPVSSRQIIDAGGTGTDNMSIWLVKWGPGGVYGIYPKGSRVGLVHDDYGVELCTAPDGTGELPMYRDWFVWNHGIAVEDWRNVVRIANIDSSDLTKNAASGADLIDLMVQAEELIDGEGDDSRLVWYVPGRIRSFLRRQMLNKSNVYLTNETIAGRRVTAFNGKPLRKVDRLLQTEARIV